VAGQDGPQCPEAISYVNDLWSKNDDVRRVREASDIVRIVGEHVALKARGREFVGLCPFHDDHSPSMNVIPSKQIFHCFVCNAGGDVLTFVRKFHGMEFREALELLAQRAGVTLTPRRARAQGESEDEISAADLRRASAVARDFFQTILRHSEHGAAARAIIEKRGLTPEAVEQFQIGASPDRWDGLIKTLEGKKLDLRPFIELGLVRARETGGHYDGFRNRLMFPIFDRAGNPIAFGARKIDEADEPKYLNSIDMRLFNKSRTLYGLSHATRDIQKLGVTVVCEGYMDVIACHQAGVANVVGVLGTALTREHAQVLRQICHTVVLLFDGDEAGQRAADRSFDVFFNEDVDVKIATLASVTDAKDPDELLKREGGHELLAAAVAKAVDVMEYRYRRLAATLKGAGAAETNRIVEEDLRKLVELGLMNTRPVRRQLILKRLSQIAGVDAQAIVASRPMGRNGPRPGASASQDTPARVRPGLIEHLLGCILCDPELWETLDAPRRDAVLAACYGSPTLAGIAHTIRDLSLRGESAALSSVLTELDDVPTQEVAVALASHVERVTDSSTDKARSLWADTLVHLKREEIKRDHDSSSAEDKANVFARVQLKQREHAELGANRRVLPRPRF